MTGVLGLDEAEFHDLLSGAGSARIHVVRSCLDDETTARVVETLRSTLSYRRLHDALLHPDTNHGRELHIRLRQVLSGDTELPDVLAPYA